MVKVKLFANFREIAGKKILEIKARDVEELISRLVDLFPDMEDLIEREEYLHVMVNGIHINSLEKQRTKLEDEDVVAIFPPVSGG
jgi:MoaD family protein